MIVFDPATWTISLPPGESVIGRQYDNMTRSIVISGVPDGWDWTLLVQASGKLDIIDLEPVEGGVGVTLTAQQLSLAGFYTIQLRGNQSDLVRHTNVLQVLVPKSLSGSATWPTVPSAVEQVLQQLEELNQHPPYPGDNGYWMVWDLDTHTYVESQLPLPPVAEGPAGKDATITVGETITGEPGKPASVVNTGTENAAVLRFTIPSGATGATPDISVEVTGLPGGSEPTVDVSGTPEAPVISLGIPAGRDGDDGQTPNITTGTVETLPAGSNATASISGQTPNLVLNLGIPQGQQGDPGEAATVTVGTTTTGAPGSQASVVNSGTPAAAVFDFTIPAGETGAGLPPTDTAQTGDVPTWDGQQVVWAPPAGGGGKYEQIAAITLDEEVSQLQITSEQYPLLTNKQHLLVRIRVDPNRLTSGWIHCRMGTKDVNIADNTSNTAIIAARIDVINGYWAANSTTSSNNASVQNVDAPVIPFLQTGGFSSNFSEYESYESFLIYGNNFELPAGTVITIWGA